MTGSQSNPGSLRGNDLACFVASLLAMTGAADTFVTRLPCEISDGRPVQRSPVGPSLEPFSSGLPLSKHFPTSRQIHRSFEDRSRDRHSSLRRRPKQLLPRTWL